MAKIYYYKVEKKKKEKIVEKKGKIKKKEEKFNGKIFDYELFFNMIIFFKDLVRVFVVVVVLILV